MSKPDISRMSALQIRRAYDRGDLDEILGRDYGDDGYEGRSFFADLYQKAEADRGSRVGFELGVRIDEPVDEKYRNVSTPAADRQTRLAKAATMNQRFRNDLTSTTAGDFIPSGAPVRVAAAFAESVKARAVVAPLLRRLPLPEFGMAVEEPRLSSGPSVTVQSTENTAVSETDPVDELESDSIVTIAGSVDISRQAFERSSPELDESIASELGGVYAQYLDEQIVNGSGSGELQGLLGVTGITSVAYTDTTPTVAEAWPKLLETISSTSTAWKNPAGTVLLHLRRLAWLYSVLATPPVPPPGVSLVASGAIPANLGAGTNEDAVLVLDPQAVKLYTAAPQFRVTVDNAGSSNLTVKVWVYGYAALGSSRQPAAIGKLSGTGLVVPTFA